MNLKSLILPALAAFSLFSTAAPAQPNSPEPTAPDEVAEQATPQPQAQQRLTPGMQLANWYKRAAEAYAAEDHQAWVNALENLHRLRPFNYDFMRQLVMGYALTGKTSEAFNMMLRMQQQGLGADWDEVEEVESLRQYPLYPHLRDLMKSAGEPAGQATEVFTIDADHPMPEALAFDAGTGRIFVGTVRDGSIFVRGAEDDAELTLFAEPEDTPGLRAVFDLLVDDDRGHLWVATGTTSQYRDARPSDFGRTGLIKLDLETGDKLGEFRVLPDGQQHMLGAMALAADGTIYAADGAAPLVYRLRPGDERPTPFFGAPFFTGLRGIALAGDDRLYLADYDLGLFFFDLDEKREGFALGIPETLNLGGIDGLYHWDGHLVAIQNGVTPQRVLRLKLDESGTRVASIATMAKALPSFDNPTFGTVAGDDLLFLAASHWHRVGPKGRVVNPPLPDVPVLRSSIKDAKNVVVGEEMLEKLKRQGGPVMPRR